MPELADRHPHDGEPYYCVVCGEDLTEYLECSDDDCKLESVEVAQRRARNKRHIEPIDLGRGEHDSQ